MRTRRKGSGYPKKKEGKALRGHVLLLEKLGNCDKLVIMFDMTT